MIIHECVVGMTTTNASNQDAVIERVLQLYDLEDASQMQLKYQEMYIEKLYMDAALKMINYGAKEDKLDMLKQAYDECREDQGLFLTFRATIAKLAHKTMQETQPDGVTKNNLCQKQFQFRTVVHMRTYILKLDMWHWVMSRVKQLLNGTAKIQENKIRDIENIFVEAANCMHALDTKYARNDMMQVLRLQKVETEVLEWQRQKDIVWNAICYGLE